MCKKMICLTTLVLLVACLSATPVMAACYITDDIGDEHASPVAVYAASANNVTIDNTIDRDLCTTRGMWDINVPTGGEDPAWVIFDMGTANTKLTHLVWWNRPTSNNLGPENIDVYIFTDDDPTKAPILSDSNLATGNRSHGNDEVVSDEINITDITVQYIKLVFDNGQQSGETNIQIGEIAFKGIAFIPKIKDPAPAHNGTDYGRNQSLVWMSDPSHTKVDVYFGTNGGDVTSATTSTAGIYKGRQDSNDWTHTPNNVPLDPNTKHWFRIDAINDTNVSNVLIAKGETWLFTTAAPFQDGYLVIDDIESYGERSTLAAGSYVDQEELRKVWIDGFDGSTTMTSGAFATVNTARESHGPGDPGTGPAHRDYLSLAIDYDNDGFQIFVIRPTKTNVIAGSTNLYSEVYAATTGANSLDTRSDWTEPNSVALQLYFGGPNTNNVHDYNETLYVVLQDSNGDDGMVVLYDGDINDFNDDEWHKWDIDVNDFNSAGMDMADVNRIYIGFGVRGETVTAGGTGVIFIDDIRLHPQRCRNKDLESGGGDNPEDIPGADFNGDCLVDFKDMRIQLMQEWLSDER